MTMRRCIGGEFELREIRRGSVDRLSDLIGCALSWSPSGRSALGTVLTHLRSRGVTGLHLPAYLCESLILPATALGLEVSFYPVDLDGNAFPDPPSGSAVLVIHYFGWPNPVVEDIASQSDLVLIEDYSHILPGQRLVQVGPDRFVFGSLRKFGPVPLGGWCSCESGVENCEPELDGLMWRSIAARFARASYLSLPEAEVDREQEEFYLEAFRSIEECLDVNPMTHTIPAESLKIAAGINWSRVSRQRRNNWILLDQVLSDRLDRLYTSLPDDVVPLGYVIRLPDRDRVRERLRGERVFCPVHWPLPKAISSASFPEAEKLSQTCLTLPIDQRYGDSDLHQLADSVIRSL